MALSSFNTKLTIGTKDYVIKDFPSILGQRSALETTTLSDDAQTFIQGIRQQSDSFAFLANYDATVYDEINKLTKSKNKENLHSASANLAIFTTTPHGHRHAWQ